ncbi:hypothetical protein JOE44_004136 [Chryseobacterium sp. PvR013]|uniref:hypothetical protein n=1 Tax=Chryseobacterium sp. PvR013 TaxID=2806595 RepID=UPI001AEB2703|nr:hypothetical protein [Chryseobacterium sp. PvR013]MBP1167252.1 hypothetical protein [Chryseobacterium sp. PvR013]
MLEDKKIKKIPIEEVVEFFQNEGVEITEEEAELIMEFLYTLTSSVIRQYFGSE